MIFDAYKLSRAMNSVAIAQSTEKGADHLYRATHVEFYEGKGARFTCSNLYFLLTAWVPERFVDDVTPPAADEAPTATVIIKDVQRRMKSLLDFCYGITKQEDSDGFAINLDLITPPDEDTLEGLEPTVVHMTIPHKEVVILPTHEQAVMDWRKVSDDPGSKAILGFVVTTEQLRWLAALKKYNPTTYVKLVMTDTDHIHLNIEDAELTGVFRPYEVNKTDEPEADELDFEEEEEDDDERPLHETLDAIDKLVDEANKEDA